MDYCMKTPKLKFDPDALHREGRGFESLTSHQPSLVAERRVKAVTPKIPCQRDVGGQTSRYKTTAWHAI